LTTEARISDIEITEWGDNLVAGGSGNPVPVTLPGPTACWDGAGSDKESAEMEGERVEVVYESEGEGDIPKVLFWVGRKTLDEETARMR